MNKIKDFIHTIKYYYAEFCNINRNQWKHGLVGVVIAIIGFLTMWITPEFNVTPTQIAYLSFFAMILFELIQANFAKSLNCEYNRFKIVDSIFDILIGLSGTIFLLHIFQ